MRGNGGVRRRAAITVAASLVISMGVVAGSLAVPSGVAVAAEVFSEPLPVEADRIEQPRDVTSIAPARLVDTRAAGVTVDGASQGGGAIGAGQIYEVPVRGRGGVPTDAAAVVMNVTAVRPLALGFLTVFPCGEDVPTASNVNYVAGVNVPNAVLAKVGSGGKVCVFTSQATSLLVDVNGFVAAGAATTPIRPARLVDTRANGQTTDGRDQGGGAVAAGGTYEVTVRGRGGVPAAAAAVVLNVTAVRPSALGFLTVYPCGGDVPTASNVNYVAGVNVPNAVLAKVGDGGKVCIYSSASTLLLVDVNGFVTSGESTTPIDPARLVDSRRGGDTADDRYEGIGRVAAGGTFRFAVTGRGGVPDVGVGAVMLNVTAVRPLANGFLTVFPCGQDVPTASNVNYVAGVNVPNAVLAQIGAGGDVCVYSSAATDLVIDANGWFALPPNQPESNVTVLEPGEFEFVVVPPTTTVQSFGERLTEATPVTAVVKTDTTNIEEGDTIVAVKPDGDPYYGRVEERTDETIRMEEVALADVVPVVDVELEADPETGKVTATEGAESISDTSVEPDADAPQEKKPQSANKSCNAAVDVTLNVTADAYPGRFVFDVSFNKTYTGLRSARIGYNPGVVAQATVAVGGAVTCTVSKTLFEKDLPTIRFAIAGVPVVVKQELEVNLTGELSATAAGSNVFTADASAFVGVVYEDGQWDRETSIDFDVDRASETGLQIDLRLGVPEIVYKARAYGIIGFDATLAANLRLTYRPAAEKYLRMTASIDVQVAAVIELDLKLIAFRFAYEFVNTTLFGPLEIFALEKAATKCGSITTSIPEAQCDALVALYDANNGSNWRDKGAWGSNSDPCTWPGVTCSGGNVTELVLNNRNVTGAIVGDLGDLAGLEVLDLAGNDLDSIPSELGGLGAIRELRLDNAGLTSIPYAIGDAGSLRVLELSSNGLTSLPPAIIGLRNLRELNVSFNQIGMLPSAISGLTELEWLDARANGLTWLPSSLWTLDQLDFLDVSNNPLDTMPSAVGALTNLSGLFWSNTEITTVPSQVGSLTKMEFLKLDGNELTTVPASIGDLPVLERLYVSFNRMTTAPAALSRVSGLTHLYAGGNPWDTDFTSTAQAIRSRNPGLLAFDLGPVGCPRITVASTIAWVETFDPRWDNGC